MPWFEVFSLSPSGSQVDARLARLQFGAQELGSRERAQKLEHNFRLSVRKLEIEAETQVKLRQLELQSATSQSTVTTPSLPTLLGANYDVHRHVVQWNRSCRLFLHVWARQWPKEIWTTLLQCKLTGKAQDVMATLTMEESLNYNVVKAAVLRVYELVPEDYGQKYQNHRKE